METMKTLRTSQSIDESLNELVRHSLGLERDNMLLKKALRTMAKNVCLNEDGKTTMELTVEDVELVKYACDTCNVFNIGDTSE